MASLIEDAWETYAKNIRLVLLFSIPFIIAFLIPALVPVPTYISSGAIFLRTASIFLNLNPAALAIIVISLFISLLFLSFAFVAISLIVKAERTFTKHPAAVLRGVEQYTGRVFIVLLVYALILLGVNVLGYFLNLQGLLTAIVGFFLFMAIFYAPTAIVIDNKRIGTALNQSLELVAKQPGYFIMWVVVLVFVVGVVDFAVIHATGTLLSSYIMLVLNSLLILPYFVIFQAEAYMKRFSILKH
ncbi:MAG: hypothetical protein KGI04_00840 [Candidatus Micrarchaeota archaeon]|nr:hypothetical protein [Candidatus Micrarchaeota archaeon]